VNANDVITVANLNANLLVYTPALNENGTPYTTIGFKVGNGTVFSSRLHADRERDARERCADDRQQPLRSTKTR
jgi:hypothetical protein